MIFFSTMTYSLGKQLGLEGAAAEFERMLRRAPEAAHNALQLQPLPCTRVVARLRQVDGVQVWHDAGATSIAKARSPAFHAAYKSDADVWVMCDDDVDASSEALENLLDLARQGNCVAFAPCLLRGKRTINVFRDPKTHPADSIAWGGLGLAAMNREAMRTLIDKNNSTTGALQFLDDDGETKLPLFHEDIVPVYNAPDDFPDWQWLGEDLSFCRRAQRAGLELRMVTRGITNHAGQTLSCADAQKVLEDAAQ